MKAKQPKNMSEVEGSLRLWMRIAMTSKLAGIPTITLMHCMARSKRTASIRFSHPSTALKDVAVLFMNAVVLRGSWVRMDVELSDESFVSMFVLPQKSAV